jgi:hypothetical protein
MPKMLKMMRKKAKRNNPKKPPKQVKKSYPLVLGADETLNQSRSKHSNCKRVSKYRRGPSATQQSHL